jgi:SAM-dependent methyltransferase
MRMNNSITTMTPAFRQTLIDSASAPYRAADPYAWHFARSKLKCDPAFVTLLKHGLIPQNARLLDLGSGQGLLTAWLLAARQHATDQDWPREWPPAPQLTSIHGIELMARDHARACQALGNGKFGNQARFTQGNIAEAEFGEADVVVILDVLHYIEHEAQRNILLRVRQALAPDGVLLLRIGDAGGGLRYKMSLWYDRMIWKLRGARRSQLYCRTLDEWRKLLQAIGFEVDVVPMDHGLTLANVMLVAKPVLAPSQNNINEP